MESISNKYEARLGRKKRFILIKYTVHWLRLQGLCNTEYRVIYKLQKYLSSFYLMIFNLWIMSGKIRVFFSSWYWVFLLYVGLLAVILSGVVWSSHLVAVIMYTQTFIVVSSYRETLRGLALRHYVVYIGLCPSTKYIGSGSLCTPCDQACGRKLHVCVPRIQNCTFCLQTAKFCQHMLE